MSELRVDNIVSQDGTAAPTYTQGVIVAAGRTLTNNGDFTVAGNTTLAGIVSITNAGVTTVAGTLDVTSTGISTFTGNVWVGGAGTITGSLDILGGGTLNTAGIITASLIDVTSEIQYANLAVLSGNVGFGTTSGYGGRLNVNDDIVLSSGVSTTSDMAIRAYSTGSGMLSFEDIDANQQYFSINKDFTTLFAVNDASYDSKVIVGAAGSIGIGTDATVGAGLTSLHVFGQSQLNRVAITTTASNLTLEAGRTFVYYSTGTYTLPASPTAGDRIEIINRSGTVSAVLARNGSNIMGVADDLDLDILDATFKITYSNDTDGWVVGT